MVTRSAALSRTAPRAQQCATVGTRVSMSRWIQVKVSRLCDDPACPGWTGKRTHCPDWHSWALLRIKDRPSDLEVLEETMHPMPLLPAHTRICPSYLISRHTPSSGCLRGKACSGLHVGVRHDPRVDLTAVERRAGVLTKEEANVST